MKFFTNFLPLKAELYIFLVCLQYEFLIAVIMKRFLLDITPRSPVKVNRHFEGTYRVCLQDRRVRQAGKQHGGRNKLKQLDLYRIGGILPAGKYAPIGSSSLAVFLRLSEGRKFAGYAFSSNWYCKMNT
jgi:hypothetical protein